MLNLITRQINCLKRKIKNKTMRNFLDYVKETFEILL